MFQPNDEQRAIVEAIEKLMAPFDESYWRDCEVEGRFPEEFRRAVAEGGWLGIALPQDCGGSGLGVVEAVLMMQAIANSPGAMAAASAVHMNIFAPQAIVRHGTQAQRQRWLPPIVAGDLITCFGVTEPDAGLDTSRIATRAERDGAAYVITGQKIWTSTAQQAERVLLLARTTPIEDVQNPADGLTLFFAALDPAHVEIREIAKMGRQAVDSNVVLYDRLPVPAEDRIGAEGQGFRILLDSLNPERCLVAAEAVGIGRQALSRAAAYARERVVFGRPIGQNQAIQHPLAECHMQLEAAWLTTLQAAALYDAGQPCGVEANSAKYLAGADDGLCRVAPLLSRIERRLGLDWRAYLAQKATPEEIETFERHARSGRPLGSRAFLKRLEARTGLDLQPRPRGQPRKDAAEGR